MITLNRFLWAIAAGIAIGLVAVQAIRMTGTPVAGWALLIAIFAAAYLGTARADRR